MSGSAAGPGARLSALVGFAVIPDSPRMMPPVEALVVQQADPPEVAVSVVERAGRASDVLRGPAHY